MPLLESMISRITGSTKDVMLAAIARNIWLEIAKWDIEIKLTHIPGVTNMIADLLSRWDSTLLAEEKTPFTPSLPYRVSHIPRPAYD